MCLNTHRDEHHLRGNSRSRTETAQNSYEVLCAYRSINMMLSLTSRSRRRRLVENERCVNGCMIHFLTDCFHHNSLTRRARNASVASLFFPVVFLAGLWCVWHHCQQNTERLSGDSLVVTTGRKLNSRPVYLFNCWTTLARGVHYGFFCVLLFKRGNKRNTGETRRLYFTRQHTKISPLPVRKFIGNWPTRS